VPWYDDISMPALLRAARRTYGTAIRSALEDAGFDDVPRNGVFLLASLARANEPLSEIVKYLGTSKQAAGQLTDTLVARGYLERAVDPADRRRLTVTLTERGSAAARAIRGAADATDAAITAKVGAERIAQTRRTLAALITLRTPEAEPG